MFDNQELVEQIRVCAEVLRRNPDNLEKVAKVQKSLLKIADRLESNNTTLYQHLSKAVEKSEKPKNASPNPEK